MAIDLHDVPEARQTYAMCLDSVQADWGQLAFVREDLQTNDLCLCAITQNANALQYVTNQTPEICLKAIKKDGYALRFVEKQTPELCWEAVKKNGWTIESVKVITL